MASMMVTGVVENSSLPLDPLRASNNGRLNESLIILSTSGTSSEDLFIDSITLILRLLNFTWPEANYPPCETIGIEDFNRK